jgi:Fic family protein
MYIYEHKDWPNFIWDAKKLLPLISEVRNKQGRLLGKMASLGFELSNEANLEMLSLEIVKSTEIEGEFLEMDQVRSSIARNLGLQISNLVSSERHVDGIVDLMIDATKNYSKKLSASRLFSWHNSLFPNSKSGLYTISAGKWRNDAKGPMRVVSGAIGKENIHYQAPSHQVINKEIKLFLDWFNTNDSTETLVKAAIAHLWFITIHPFEDGNGRISRAITEMLLARSDDQANRYYSMSSQIRKERQSYYDVLERTQQGKLDISKWIEWFLNCLLNAITNSEKILEKVIHKHSFWQNSSSLNLNDRQRKILNMLLDNFEGALNTSKWAKITKCSQDTALRDIQELIEQNILIKSLEGGRSTNYELNI